MPLAADPFTNADVLRVPAGPGAVHVERYGYGGKPVVLLHGFGTSAFLWRHVGPELALAGVRAFAVDLLGYGESDRPLDASFGIAAQAESLDRALTALRIASATVVGVDLGGAVALRLAATRPERVERLVLVNSLGPEECPAEDVDALARATARFLFRISRGLLGAAPLLQSILERSVADPERSMPARLVARYLAPYVGREGVRHLLTLARAIQEDDLEELALDSLAVPTLVVRGESDFWLESRTAESLAATLPKARFVALPGVGRLVPEEAPEQLTRLILEEMGLREPLVEPVVAPVAAAAEGESPAPELDHVPVPPAPPRATPRRSRAIDGAPARDHAAEQAPPDQV